jgi:toxin secretion/phage lysis holin
MMQYVLALSFIVVDILTGTLAAIKTRTWTSTKMREGGFHKMAIILFIALAVLCDYAQNYIDLGFKIPLTKYVIVYVCVMEIGSSGENIGKMYPMLKTKITTLFKGGEK